MSSRLKYLTNLAKQIMHTLDYWESELEEGDTSSPIYYEIKKLERELDSVCERIEKEKSKWVYKYQFWF